MVGKPYLLVSVRLSILILLVFLISACGVNGASENEAAAVEEEKKSEPNIHFGSVGDGPLKGATITFRGNDGAIISTLFSDDLAAYSIKLPDGTEYPVTLSAYGGIDTVTGKAPTFTLMSAALTGGQPIANINPFTTLIVMGAQQLSGGINKENLEKMTSHVIKHVNFGLDTTTVSQPINSLITQNNVSSILRSGEALAEMFKRTHAVLELAGINITQDELIESLAADLTDGLLDGIGTPKAEPLYAAVANIITAQVTIEVLSNNLKVGNRLAIPLLDAALYETMPGLPAGISVASAPITKEILNQALSTINATLELTSNQAIHDIYSVVKNLREGDNPQTTSTIPSNNLDQFSDIAILLAAAGDSQRWNIVNDSIRQNSLVNFSLPVINQIPIVSVSSDDFLDANHSPDKIIDGIGWSYWAAYGMPESITLDFGNPKEISNVMISFLNYDQGRSYQYSISTSADKVTWTSVVANGSSGQRRWTDNIINPTTARYVKITVNNSTDSNWTGIYEVRVLEPAPVSSPTPNTNTTPTPAPDSSNSTPFARNDSASVFENESVQINVSSNDVGLNDAPIILDIFSPARNGTAEVNSFGGITYTPTPSFVGWDQFVYKITDADGDIGTATVFIRVQCNGCTQPAISTSISWTANNDNIDGYMVFYGPTPDTAILPLDIIPKGTAGFNFSNPSTTYGLESLGLNAGDSLCIRLKAFSKLLESLYSASVCTTL